MTNPPQALYELAGGEAVLRLVIEDFYDRVFPDAMIGFFFKGLEKANLVQLELEFAMGFLGADVEYTGRPIRQAHAKHPIMGGQFNRRLQILKETLADHSLPQAVQSCWIEHTLSLRGEITPDVEGQCKPRIP
jgi:hemoglobin